MPEKLFASTVERYEREDIDYRVLCQMDFCFLNTGRLPIQAVRALKERISFVATQNAPTTVIEQYNENPAERVILVL